VNVLASSLVAASAVVILLLALVHLLYTFHGTKLHPRDPQLTAALKEASLVLTRQTTMWKAWVGFNVSHSFGAILFGAVYDYLAVVQSTFLFRSQFLLGLGLLLLVGYALLGKFYWFSTPLRGIVLAMLLYLGGLLAASA
jgi:hypothetical protein